MLTVLTATTTTAPLLLLLLFFSFLLQVLWPSTAPERCVQSWGDVRAQHLTMPILSPHLPPTFAHSLELIFCPPLPPLAPLPPPPQQHGVFEVFLSKVHGHRSTDPLFPAVAPLLIGATVKRNPAGPEWLTSSSATSSNDDGGAGG